MTGEPVTWADPAVQLDGGYLHFCALTASGAVRCWGGTDDGVVESPGPWVEVRAGMYQTCALAASGAVTCWGTKGPNGEPASPPTVVEGLPPLVTFDVAQEAICGLDAGGTAWCSGSDRVAHEAPMGPFVAISLGFNHGCALGEDGMLACWGAGSVADGEPPFQAVPPTWPVEAVAAGLGYHTCALRPDHTIGCWGGDGGGDGGTVFAGNLRAPPGRYRALAAGYVHTCAVRWDRAVACWGEVASPDPSYRFRFIASGHQGTCGVLLDGRLTCWGSDQFGTISQLPAGPIPRRLGPR